MNRSIFACCIFLLSATAAHADDAGAIVRLSPEQIAAVQAEALKAHAAEPFDPSEINRPRTQIHGEIGFGIGTGGRRETYGSFGAPLGSDGFVAFSFFDGTNRAFAR